MNEQVSGQVSYLGAAHDTREHGAWGIVTCEACLTPEVEETASVSLMIDASEKISFIDMGGTRRYNYGKCSRMRRESKSLHPGTIVHHESLYFFLVVHGLLFFFF